MSNVRNERMKNIGYDFGEILRIVGYKHDAAYNLDTQTRKIKDKLAKLFFDYMIASIYDCSWEGFNTKDLQGIQRLIGDMKLFAESEQQQEQKQS